MESRADCAGAVQPRSKVKGTGRALGKAASKGMCAVSKHRLSKAVASSRRLGNVVMDSKCPHSGIGGAAVPQAKHIWVSGNCWDEGKFGGAMVLTQFAGESQCWHFPGEGRNSPFFVLEGALTFQAGAGSPVPGEGLCQPWQGGCSLCPQAALPALLLSSCVQAQN